MSNLLVNNIYYAVEGEGVRIGTPQIFIRLQGCKIGCKNCDSKETWAFSGLPQTVEDIVFQVKKLSQNQKNFWVSITGGDPLDPFHRKGLLKLCHTLKKENFHINIEASGLRFVPNIFSLVDFISCDFKTPSTGVKGSLKTLKDLVEKYPQKYQIKSVISDKNDFQAVSKAYEALKEKLSHKPLWILTPCFNTGDEKPTQHISELFQKMLTHPHFRVIAQQHKFIYGTQRLDI